MAETALNYNEEPDDEAEERAKLRGIEGGGEGGGPKSSRDNIKPVEDPVYDHKPNTPSPAPGGKNRHLRSVPDRQNLADMEKKPYGATSRDAGGDAGWKSNVGIGGLGMGKQKWLYRHRKKVFGGGIAGTVAGLVMFISMISGPLQFAHLGQILSRGLSGDEHTSHLRLTRLYRFAKTGQIGETRLGGVGSRYFGKSIDQLRAAGIEFQTDGRGYMKSATFDTTALEEKFPEMKGMSLGDKKAFLGEKFGLDPASFNRVNGKLAINTRDFGVGATRALAKNSISVLDNGKIVSSLKLRVMSKYFDLPSLWHPIEKAKAATYKKLSVSAQRAAIKKAEEDRLKALDTTTKTTEAIDAKAKIKNAFSDNTGKIIGFLTVQGTICLIYGAADEAVTLNRAAIVLPATLQAADKVALGNQVESGQDFVSSQLAAVSGFFKDANGNSIWQGKALQAAAGKSTLSGPDLPSQYSQAYSGHTTADSIKKSVEVSILGLNITGAVCSNIGQAAGLVVGVGTLISGYADFGGSDAAYLAIKSAEIAGTAGVYYMLQKEAVNLIKDDSIVPEIMSGPLGGNLMAYGGREMANIAARSAGGVAMADTATSVVSQAEQKAEDQQFAQKGWFAKLFDAKDYRSASGKLVDSTSSSFMNNLAKMGGGLLHIGNIFSSFSNLLFHPATAATRPYNWGFERYGIPDSVAADQKFDNPYTNADQVAAILDSQNCSFDGSCYVDRAAACFGVTIDKDSNNQWEVISKGDVNPDAQSYTNANCNDDSENWHRLQLFVFDSRTMDAAACYAGDSSDAQTQQSCVTTGIDQASTNQSSSNDNGGSNGSLTNPFPGGWSPNRLDQGYDGTFKGKIVAPFSGKITYAATGVATWGGYLDIKADQKPDSLPTSTLYFAEGLAPVVKTGDHVNAGDPIASPAPSPYGNAYGTTADGSGQIEWGVASDGSVGTYTLPYAQVLGGGQCSKNQNTPQAKSMVLNFASWAVQNFGLGQPTTTTDAGCG